MDESRTAPGFDFESRVVQVRDLIRSGDNEGTLRVAAELEQVADTPERSGRALIAQVGALVNLGRARECPELLDRAFHRLDGTGEHASIANVHAVAAIVAAPDSHERAIRHLVQATCSLELIEQPTAAAAGAWHDIAVSYSYLGFHRQSLVASERSYSTARAAGLGPGDHALPEIAVRAAVAADHLGDSRSCVHGLRDVLATWAKRCAPDQLWTPERLYHSYASARLRALGETVDLDTPPPTPDSTSWEIDDLHVLTVACEHIARGQTDAALRRLDGHDITDHTLGAAEVPRLRALAHQRAGDYRAALTVEREVVRLATGELPALRDRITQAARTQLDHEALRRLVAQYASQALTDPLTGLPNRRHFEREFHRLAGTSRRTTLGMIDVDGFKAVNSAHGHLGGDLVLQRVAAILARTVRQGDFIARYGGDEFVVVLPDTDAATADDLDERLRRAVDGGGWDALVPGTPVSVTLGWAGLEECGNLAHALETADRAMLARKSRLSGAV
ncbi:GGDEF domain-containing protein [Allosaccharopolyspora coralli]|uniref:GGDEF domain-containing protein n=1 Tax=Allosaccharopolyspora coralli TaxID=2665642 RepID=UPI001E3ACC6A|nr:GGDEF domain-containing protein [Allosaccharopolyspora coralli]